MRYRRKAERHITEHASILSLYYRPLVQSIALKGPDAVSAALGIEAYVAKIVYDEAKKIVAEGSLVAP